jgi:non-heme chloroperoxidase
MWIGAFATLLATALWAQDLAGDWQGTLKAGPQDFRLIVRFEKADGGGWNATMFSIDQGDPGAGMHASSVTLDGSNIKFAIDQIRGSFEGKLSADGASLSGTWKQGQARDLEFRRASKATAFGDSTTHRVQFVTVDKNVKLEVLDWGGTGRPLVLLAGLGNTAHVFDKFALKLNDAYHVYGITRRGFGASSTPALEAANYLADRLGDDVLAVIDALQLKDPVLAGHSIAGEELSSIGTRHPEKVAGLIYLDAGYGYAYYDREKGDLLMDSLDLKRKLDKLMPFAAPQEQKRAVDELLETDLPQFEKELQEMQKALKKVPPVPAPPPLQPTPNSAIIGGQQKYTDIRVRALAIFAVPHELGPIPNLDAAGRAAMEAKELATVKAFETGVPSARVVRLEHANHYVFRSNETDVLREMNAFIGSLGGK